MLMVNLAGKKKLIVVLVTGLIITAVSTVVIIKINESNDRSRKNEAAKAQSEYTQASSDMTGLFNNQQYDKSIEISKAYFSKPRKDEFKYEVYRQEGMAYLALQNFDAAENSLLAAQALRSGSDIDGGLLQALSFVYEGKKDNKKAAEYLKKMIEVIRTTSEPTDDAYIPGYEEKIKRLEAAQ